MVEGVTMVRILVVEDDRSFAEALASAIRLGGHDVSISTTADEAIELGSAQVPDIVIADWMLGSEVHGGEVCRQIRAVCPRVKTIVMTGYLEGESEIYRWPEYAETLLKKPFHKEAIFDAIDRALTCESMS
jgi:DNA-binding response OmpR family regulator